MKSNVVMRGLVVARVRLKSVDGHIWNLGHPRRIGAPVCAEFEKGLRPALAKRPLNPFLYLQRPLGY
jgi:hypothetical protein